jgi:hypothetical protein
MPYTQLLSRSFEILRRQPALWIIGIILAFFAGGGGGANFNAQSSLQGDFGKSLFDPSAEAPFSNLPEWLFNPETLLSAGLLFACFLIGWFIIAFVMRSVALVGLIEGVDQAAKGSNLRLLDLLGAGWSGKGGRIMAMKVLLALPMLLFWLPIFALAGFALWPLVSAMMNGNEPGAEFFTSLLGFFVGICCLGLIIFVFSWLLNLIANYAARAIVLQESTVMQGIAEGWRLLKSNFSDTIVLAILLAVMQFIVGIVMSIVTLIQSIFIVFPLFFFLESQGFPLILSMVSVIGGFLLMGVFPALLTGAMLAYFESVWTLAWQHLVLGDDKQGFEVPVAPTYG